MDKHLKSFAEVNPLLMPGPPEFKMPSTCLSYSVCSVIYFSNTLIQIRKCSGVFQRIRRRERGNFALVHVVFRCLREFLSDHKSE